MRAGEFARKHARTCAGGCAGEYAGTHAEECEG